MFTIVKKLNLTKEKSIMLNIRRNTQSRANGKIVLVMNLVQDDFMDIILAEQRIKELTKAIEYHNNRCLLYTSYGKYKPALIIKTCHFYRPFLGFVNMYADKHIKRTRFKYFFE